MGHLDVVVGLGSNLGDRLQHLRDACARIAETYEVIARSAVYETAPIGPAQPDYLNAAIRLRTDGTLEELLTTLLAIEASHGRVRTKENRWGPRTLDLDILWARGVTYESPRLTVPHPRLHERAFALLPLYDVAPDAPAFPVDDAGVRRTPLTLA
jgi:2-amino-4-hydroxy-6-hydroxymethyldihydropteridine diphosphokinase